MRGSFEQGAGGHWATQQQMRGRRWAQQQQAGGGQWPQRQVGCSGEPPPPPPDPQATAVHQQCLWQSIAGGLLVLMCLHLVAGGAQE